MTKPSGRFRGSLAAISAMMRVFSLIQPAFTSGGRQRAVRSLPKGGSRRTRSTACWALGGAVASAFQILVLSASPRDQMFSRTVAKTLVLLSKRVANLAPRDKHSRDRAPLPAKASRIVAPSRVKLVSPSSECSSILKIDSRTRSIVGRVIMAGGRDRFLPLCFPAIMRI